MRDDSQKGAAAVEMAIVFMFLLILLTGIVDVGRALYTGIAVEDAVQDGAAFAAFTEKVGGAPLQTSQVRQRVANAVSAPDIDPADVVVACVTETRAKKNGTKVTVSVTHEVPMITPFVGQWIGSINLTKSATADRYYTTCPTGA